MTHANQGLYSEESRQQLQELYTETGRNEIRTRLAAGHVSELEAQHLLLEALDIITHYNSGGALVLCQRCMTPGWKISPVLDPPGWGSSPKSYMLVCPQCLKRDLAELAAKEKTE